jgi:hypothetical protein
MATLTSRNTFLLIGVKFVRETSLSRSLVVAIATPPDLVATSAARSLAYAGNSAEEVSMLDVEYAVDFDTEQRFTRRTLDMLHDCPLQK